MKGVRKMYHIDCDTLGEIEAGESAVTAVEFAEDKAPDDSWVLITYATPIALWVPILLREDGVWRNTGGRRHPMSSTRFTIYDQRSLIWEIDAAVKQRVANIEGDLAVFLSSLYPNICNRIKTPMVITDPDAIFCSLDNRFTDPFKVFTKIFPDFHYIWQCIDVEGLSIEEQNSFRKGREVI